MLSPNWKPVLPCGTRAIIGGRHWTSPGPKIPAGRMDVVNRLGERFAARTAASASA